MIAASLAGLLACGPGPAAAPPAPEPEPEPEPAPAPASPTVLRGLCDLSGGVVVDDRWLLAVDDERNVLHRFDLADGGTPQAAIDLGALDPRLQGAEADLEGTARLGDRLWMVSSHDTGRSGTPKPARQRLLAVDLRPGASGVDVAWAGLSTRLLEAVPDLVAASSGKQAKSEQGLAIEGLAAGPDGSLWVGFRAPVLDGRAQLVRVADPDALLAGGKPQVAERQALDLGGRGVRSIEADGTGYRLIAGPAGGDGDFALYRWAGPGHAPTLWPAALGDLTPEGLVEAPGGWWVLSDDGNRDLGGTRCKDLPPAQRQARTETVGDDSG